MFTDRALTKKYKSGINYLDYFHSYFLTHVLKIGKPQADSSIPTAAVAPVEYDDQGNVDFEFVFNPEFSETLGAQSMGFILGHETMHIVLNHLRLMTNFLDRPLYEKLRDKQARGERLTKDEIKESLHMKRNMQMFNIAADCVINDYLYEGGLELGAEMQDFPLCRGEDWIGEDAAFLTVTEVYERIKNQQDSKDDGDDAEGEGQGGFTMADGSTGSYQEFDSHDWMLSPKDIDKLADALDKLNEQIENQTGLPQDIFDKKIEDEGKQTAAQQQLQQGMKAGDRDANMQDFAQQHGVQLAWVKLLNDLDPDMFKTPGIAPPMIPSFHNRRRKLMAKEFSKVNLPVYRREERKNDKAKEIPSIVLALDVSGSIGPRDADYFVSLAMTIPRERIHVFACVFQTTYQKIDLDDPKFSKGGGTSFDAVAHFINREVKPELKGKEPSAVVVITDGEAQMSPNLWPEEKARDNWLWLISPVDRTRGCRVIQSVGTKKLLKEYIN